MTRTEGYVPFTYQGDTFQTYDKIVGDLNNRTRTPVVVIHGGPGLAHDYLIPHTDLSNHSFPILFYDQVGNARSTHLSEAQAPLLSIEFFIEELVNFLIHFGIQDDYHIVGHSWGGMLAAELVVRRRAGGLKRLVLADAPTDMVLWGKSFKELLEPFPQSVKDAITKGEDADRQGWWDAMMVFYAQHGCRVQPFPEEFLTTFGYAYGENADKTVVKSSVTEGWSIVDRVHEIDAPTLVINGQYDVAQDYVMEAYIKKIPGAKWIKFEESSHMPFWEEREKYMEVVAGFLSG
ncbi:hypothetical protein V8D89_014547 [Ganoderma adspersum]